MASLKPQKLEDMVDYQQGSVVSREIISKSTGTITLFAFDKGQGLSEHKAPYDALVYIVDGNNVEIIVSGEKIQLKKGEAITIPANNPHSLRATEKFKMILTMIKS